MFLPSDRPYFAEKRENPSTIARCETKHSFFIVLEAVHMIFMLFHCGLEFMNIFISRHD